MNEQQLARLLKRIVQLTAPLPAALLASACGGTTISDPAGAGGETPIVAAGTGGVGTGGTGTGGTGTGGTGVGGGVAEGGSASGASPGGAAGATFGGAGGVGSSGGQGGVGGDACRVQVPFNCGPAAVPVPRACVPADAAPGAPLSHDTCSMICGPVGWSSCALTGLSPATATVSCMNGCAVGRRPPGFCPAAFFETHALGQHFAQLAELEAASVDAFRILRAELRAHGAPKRLLRAAGRAARDEVRHARATRALARRFGTESAPPARVRAPRRSLETIARENAVEGCVRETFGALLATWQAAAATDPVVRAAMLRISRDETRHAALSWQVQRWLDARLEPAARARVARARNDAAAELLRAIDAEATPSFAERVGLPERAQACELAAQLASELWS